jgi:hypothetical protein
MSTIGVIVAAFQQLFPIDSVAVRIGIEILTKKIKQGTDL